MDTNPDERQTELDRQMARFEERVAEEEEPENREPFTKLGTVRAALGLAERNLAEEQERLKNGNFHMAAQEQAAREMVRFLEWHVEDIKKLRDLLAASDD